MPQTATIDDHGSRIELTRGDERVTIRLCAYNSNGTGTFSEAGCTLTEFGEALEAIDLGSEENTGRRDYVRQLLEDAIGSLQDMIAGSAEEDEPEGVIDDLQTLWRELLPGEEPPGSHS